MKPGVPEPSETGSPLRRHATAVSNLAAELTHWSTVAAETLPSEQAWSASVEVGRTLLARAFDLFTEILESLQPSESGRSSAEIVSAGSGSYGEEVHRVREGNGKTAIADLAFIAKMECRQLTASLNALDPTQSKWLFIEACQRARRHMIKALTALRRVMRSELGDDAMDDTFVGELSRSLACRSVLSTFWARFEQSESLPTVRRLRLAATAVAMLQGSDAYYDLRLGDRLMLRALHARVIQWSRDHGADERVGVVLLQDLQGFVSLSRQLNLRAELVEHDAFVVARLLVEVARFDGDEGAAVDRFPMLFRLVGLSPAIDSMIRSGVIPSMAELVAALRTAIPERSKLHRGKRASTGEFETASLGVRSRRGAV